MLGRAITEQRVVSTKAIEIPAPSLGWVQSGNITRARPGQAEVLDNYIPTAQTARLRGGSTVYANIGTGVVRMFSHDASAASLFAATASGIYDTDRINGGGSAFADVSGMASGDWSTTQMGTGGGQYLCAVNGVNYEHYFDGTDWNPITDAAVNDVPYDALTSAFLVGETVTGGTSGASATILSIAQTSATEGSLKVGTITSGPFQDNEALTSASGAATADGASASASAITITGVDTSTLSQVWLFKRRKFYIERTSMSAWYLPVDGIGGAAAELDLGPIFRKGGALLFGATWSLDSGTGLDDVCIFATTEGEIAVYEGTDPASASTWSLAGVYEISRPLNKHAYFKAGGDLAILTEDGIIPVSEALRKDRAALQAVAITAPIEDAWKAAVANSTTSFPVTPTLWQDQALLMIGVPGENNIAYVANARTGAWARFTGWDVRCGAVSGDSLYFATLGGIVMKGDDGGNDNGVSYTGIYVPKFIDSGASVSVANMAGVTFKSSGTPEIKVAGLSNYEVDDISAPVPMVTNEDAIWGTGVWGTFVWGGSASARTYNQWKTIRARGYSLSFALLVTSNQTPKPQFEVLSSRIRYEAGSAL